MTDLDEILKNLKKIKLTQPSYGTEEESTPYSPFLSNDDKEYDDWRAEQDRQQQEEWERQQREWQEEQDRQQQEEQEREENRRRLQLMDLARMELDIKKGMMMNTALVSHPLARLKLHQMGYRDR